jgi:hypothetical protein
MKGLIYSPPGDIDVKTRLRAVMILALAVVLSACASQSESYEDTTAGPQCPSDMIMKCHKRTAQPAECACVRHSNIEQTIKMVIGRGPN